MNIFSLLGACLVACCSSVGSNELHLDHKRNAFNQLSGAVDTSYVVNNENSWGYVQLSTQFLSSGLMEYLNNHSSTYTYFSRFYGYSYTSNTSFYFEKIENNSNNYNAGANFLNELNQSDFDFTPQTWVGCLDELCIYQISYQNLYSLFRFDRTYLRGGNPTYYVGYPYEVFKVESDNLSTAFNGLYTKSYYGINTYMSYPAYNYISGNTTYNVYYGAYGQKVYTQVEDNSTFDSTQLSSAYTSRCTSSEQVIEEWGNLGLMDTFGDFSLRITASDTQFNLSSVSSTEGSQFYNAVSTIKYVLKPLITSDQDYTSVYQSGYDEGEANGYAIGKDVGYSDGYDVGHEEGYNTGYSTGHSVGYTEGINVVDYQFTDLFGAIADTPVLMIRSLFNFDLFGVNLLAVVLSLFTALIVFYLLRKLL